MGVPGTGFRSLNGSAIATRSRSNGFGSVSTSGISHTGYGTPYRSETGRDAIGAEGKPTTPQSQGTVQLAAKDPERVILLLPSYVVLPAFASP